MRDPLQELNELGSWDYRLVSCDGWRLRLIGGTTLTYPNSYTVEVEFAGVTYINCATDFSHARFRYASEAEAKAVAELVPVEATDKIIVIEAETMARPVSQRFILVVESVTVVKRSS